MIQIASVMPEGYQDTWFRRVQRPIPRKKLQEAAQNMIRNTISNWGSVSRWFHWVLAAIIIGMLAYGWWMNHIPARGDRLFYRTIHADIGYVVLLLMVLRLIWKIFNPSPALPPIRRTGCGSRRLSTNGRSMSSRSWWRCWGGRIPARIRRIIPAGSDCFTCRRSPRPTRPRPMPLKTGTSGQPMCCWR